jgi:hypothetical protein
MPKRSAPSSPLEDFASKKQKLDTGVSDAPVSPTPVITGPTNVTSTAEDAPVDHVVDGAENADAGENSEQSTGKKAKTPKQPPVHLAFESWKPSITVPSANPFWGCKPRTGDARPHAEQPSARDSNAATNPPLWEDRGYRFKRGSRYVKYFGPIKPEGADDGPDLDQEDLLVIKLIDMRPISKHNRSPRCSPTYYFFEAGKPKDWNNMQAIKALNDRRHQAIDRITADAPWTQRERDYLSALINQHPDASIWELTELHNDYFMDREYADGTGFGFAELSTGRTVESVRYEYLTYKPAYDDGAAPQNVRWRKDKSAAGKALEASKRMEKAFGPPSKQLENEFDNAAGAGDDASDDEKPAKKATPKKAAPKKTTTKKAAPKKETLKKTATGKVTKKTSTKKSKKESELQVAAAKAMAEQSKLADEDEELLNLAGLNAPEHIRTSSPLSLPPDSPLAPPSPPSYKPLSADLNAPDYMRSTFPHYLSGDSVASPPRAPSSISSLSDAPLSPISEAHVASPARVTGTPEPRSPSPIPEVIPETHPSSPAAFSPLQEHSPVPEMRAPSPVAIPETRPASPLPSPRVDTPVSPSRLASPAAHTPVITPRSPSPILAIVETELTTAAVASEDDLSTDDDLDALFGKEVVQETQVVVETRVPSPKPRATLRGMRDMVIDEDYDDDEEL